MKPLNGIKVIEFAGLLPAPFCGMLLADFGANVIVIDKADGRYHLLKRGKRIIKIDLKNPEGNALALQLMTKADVVIEPYRPGVMEKLGLGPDILLQKNPGLIYARMTGFGQDGPYAMKAAHDVNFVALSGLLSVLLSQHEVPAYLGLTIGDLAGGGLLCAFGIMMALFERTRSGKGQIIDASIVEGTAYLFSTMALLTQKQNPGRASWRDNMAEGKIPHYNIYPTKDGKYIAVGPLEFKFYENFLKGLGLNPAELPDRDDMANWPELIQTFKEVILTRTRQEWLDIFSELDACVTPVLELNELEKFPHMQARQSFINGIPAPAPYLSRTPGKPGEKSPESDETLNEILAEFGLNPKAVRSDQS